MMSYGVHMKTRLRELGFWERGQPINMDVGPSLDHAIVRFKQSRGLTPREYVGPLTLGELGLSPSLLNIHPTPWMNEMAKYMGLHEVRNNATLKAWLRSDGKALGDPAKLPWCGDAVDTALNLTLPNEKRTGRVAVNPYLARNWLEFGERLPNGVTPPYGAIAVFWRGERDGISGHVGFVDAYDPASGKIHIRGGNQNNMVSDVWLDTNRLLGCCYPITAPRPVIPVEFVSFTGKVSDNEA